MENLLKSYNRKYYRRIAIIHLTKWEKLVRLEISRWLIHLAFKINKDVEQAIMEHFYRS